MTYTISEFRANMWEILDKTRYEKKITMIWRRNKKEFVLISVDLLKEKWLDLNNELLLVIDELDPNEKAFNDSVREAFKIAHENWKLKKLDELVSKI